MSKTDYQEAAVLNALSGLYAGLLVGASDPAVAALEGATATEASYSGYVRQAVTLGALEGSGDDDATPSVRKNTNEMTFPAVAGSPITVRRIGFFDAEEAGNMKYYSDTDLNTAVAVGVQPHFAEEAITVSEK